MARTTFHAVRLFRGARRFLSNAAFAGVFGLIIGSMSLGGQVALAAELWVDIATGNDLTCDGSAGSPCASIGKGISLASAGDTVHVLPGDYNDGVESFPITMQPGVSLLGENGSDETFISTDFDTPVVQFSEQNFDAATSVQGFTLRGTGSDAEDNGVGFLLFGSDPGVTNISPVISNNVILSLYNGIAMYAVNTNEDMDMSPAIVNNVIQGFNGGNGSDYGTGVLAYADYGDTMSPTISQNLIASEETNDWDSQGIRMTAFGTSTGNYAAARISPAIEDNWVSRAGFGVYFYAYAGQVPAMAAEAEGGQIDGYVANNVFGRRGEIDETMSVMAVVQTDDDAGGEIDLNINKNTMLTSYGVYLAGWDSSSLVGEDQPGRINATITNNLIESTYYDNDFTLGIHAGAYDGNNEWSLEIHNNQITAYYGVHVFADSTDTDDDGRPGNHVSVNMTNNVVDAFATYNYSEAVYLWAEGGRTFNATGVFESGSIDADIRGNTLRGYHGIYAWAEGGGQFTTGAIQEGGTINVTADSNVIESMNDYKGGYGVYLYADEGSDSTGVGATTLNATLTNNTIRGYYGVWATNGWYNNSPQTYGNANMDLTLVNNTIVGGGTGPSYDEGQALYVGGGDSTSPNHPTVDNNILINTSAGTLAAAQFGRYTNPDNDPASLDNNDLFHRYPGAPIASFRGYSFYSPAVINSFGFAANNVSTEPGFSCENQKNYRLLSTSAVLDLGKAVGAPAMDFEGDARPMGGGVDIGADEFDGRRAGTTFRDVGPDNFFYLYIESLASAGITAGCLANPPMYCPSQSVSREQMAVFLIRALGIPPDTTGIQLFGDVNAAMWSYGHIQALGRLGISNGCGAGNYCPSAPVTREQMAKFLVLSLGETPDNSLPSPFADVSPASIFYGYIKKLASLGITNGCGAGNYCPAQAVTREQMAAFLVRAFDLPLPLPCTGRVADRGVLVGLQPETTPQGPVDGVVGPTRMSPEMLAFEATGRLDSAGPVVAGSGIPQWRGASQNESFGAGQDVGPTSNGRLVLSATQRDLMHVERPTTYPNRTSRAGRAANAGMTKRELRLQVQADVDSFMADWRAAGKDPSQLSERRLRMWFTRKLRFPGSTAPVDFDRWILGGKERRDLVPRHTRRNLHRRAARTEQGAPAPCTAVAPTGGRTREQ